MKQVDDDLQIERKEIESFAANHDQLMEVVPVRHLVIKYYPVEQPFRELRFRNFRANDSSVNDRDNFRGLDFGVRAAGQEYMVTVMKPLEATESLMWTIVLFGLFTILLLLACFYFLNRAVLKKLWSPFFDTLSSVKSFSVSRKTALQLPTTNIDEFRKMNQILESTTNKAQQDYLLLKEFTENASHEMQTPLAIIQSKLDLLIQDEHLSEKQSIVAQTVYESIQKLSRLNQSLLLLARIGNSQFDETAHIHFAEKIRKKMEAFQELWHDENIRVSSSLCDETLKMNPTLADILLNNLLSNATKHNVKGGKIHIDLKPSELTINNTAQDGPLDPARLYTKFFTVKKTISNNGLGLSIIKHICDASGFAINYHYHNSQHFFTINW